MPQRWDGVIEASSRVANERWRGATKRSMWRKNLRLVTGGDPRLAPRLHDGSEVAHADPVGQPLKADVADNTVDDRGCVVVRVRDHRNQQRGVRAVERPSAHRRSIEVGDHQHRLDDTRRPLNVVGTVAVEAARCANGERDVSIAPARVGEGGIHVRSPDLIERLARARDHAGPGRGSRRRRRPGRRETDPHGGQHTQQRLAVAAGDQDRDRRADTFTVSLFASPRSSVGQSDGLLSRGSQVRVLPGALEGDRRRW